MLFLNVLKLNTNAADWSSTKNMIEYRASRVHPLCLSQSTLSTDHLQGSNSALTWALCGGVHNVGLVWQRFSACLDNKLTAVKVAADLVLVAFRLSAVITSLYRDVMFNN